MVAVFAAALGLATAFTLVAPAPADAKRRSSPVYVQRQPEPDDPLTIVVSLSKQRLSVFDSKGLVATSPVSSGARGHATPTGIFSVLEKNRTHFSNLYYNAPMPNMQRLTWSGIAMHAGALPGYPASHGCIRLPYSFSRQLFSMTNVGTRVIVSDDPVEPTAFTHPKLFAALPPGKADIPRPARRPDNLGIESAASGVGTISAMLGVTPAAAAEAAVKIAAQTPGQTPGQTNGEMPGHSSATGSGQSDDGPPQRTRAMVMAELQSMIDSRAATLSAREDDVTRSAEALKSLNEKLKAQRVAVYEARAGIKVRDRELSRAEGFQKAAERRLKDFINQQKREMARLQDREDRRRAAHEQDGASDRSTENLLARAEAREQEAQRDAKQRDEAIAREGELESELLDRTHEAEAAALVASSQRNLVAAHEAAQAEITAELVAGRKAFVASKKALEEARTEHKRAISALNQFNKPATVLVSRATGKLHVRQGFQDVYEAPVTIAHPDAKIGTHVFSAVGYSSSEQTDLDWRAVTVTDVGPELPRRPRDSRRKVAAAQPQQSSAPIATADNALSRIEMSDAVRMRIREVMKPGSTLIITDKPLSNETGKGTDLIVERW